MTCLDLSSLAHINLMLLSQIKTLSKTFNCCLRLPLRVILSRLLLQYKCFSQGLLYVNMHLALPSEVINDINFQVDGYQM